MTSRYRGLHCAGRRAGTTTVELALVFPILITLLFSIIEIGMLTRTNLMLRHAAGEAVRAAAVGATPSELDALVKTCLRGFDTTLVGRDYQWRSWDADVAAWSEKTPLASTDNGENDAPEGAKIEITLSYSYRLLTGSLMAQMLHAHENNTIPLSVTVSTTRE